MLWDNIGQLLPGFPWHILVFLGIFFGVLIFEDLKKVDGVPFTTYVEAYQYCQQHHQNHPQDYYGRFDESDATPPDDEHAEEYTEQDEDVPREAWQELANIIPQHDPEGCEL
ncbi:hypothetical protein E4U15_007564 [Claviceps sp. LM218 group G6]|nr:hypothetical protein E4U15_007564 [Claviceps sp. LM218 group G6]